MSLNLGDLASNAGQLGANLLDGLRTDLLSHLTDPAEIDLLARATTKIANGGIGLVAATPEVLAQAQEDYNTGLAVVLSLSSASMEELDVAQRNARAKLATFVQDFIALAITTAIKAIPLAAI